MMPLWFRKTCTSASQHLTMSLLTLQGPLTLLFNIKLVNSLLLLFKGLTQDCRATDVVASDGPDPTGSTEFTHPEISQWEQQYTNFLGVSGEKFLLHLFSWEENAL